MKHDTYDNAYIAGILNSVKTIAMVGASANDVRPSWFVPVHQRADRAPGEPLAAMIGMSGDRFDHQHAMAEYAIGDGGGAPAGAR